MDKPGEAVSVGVDRGRYVYLSRRVYEDELGRRHKPLDEARGLKAYQRATSYVQEFGAYLASHESYWVTAEVLGEIVGESISLTRVQHIVWGVGRGLDDEGSREREEVFERGGVVSGGQEGVPMLYGEPDGIYVRLQREAERRTEVRVGIVCGGEGEDWAYAMGSDEESGGDRADIGQPDMAGDGAQGRVSGVRSRFVRMPGGWGGTEVHG